MPVRIQQNHFNPWSELTDYESFLQSQNDRYYAIGATATFVGTMRDFNEGDDVESMVLEHYPEMVIHVISELESRAHDRWSLHDIFIMHRIGQIYPGEPIVLIAVWSAHRKDAFEACRYVIEQLKSTAPFWKQEKLASGDKRWVENNTAGY
ncbi:MAG: molybdenum cofactor biosynthesis protein MoaE [Gammaproteobacteria bacterium]|nr:MAG: molybdenum cofactor biosynthesis protein MoaE [Gammaproteobacteria bacterium]